MNQAYIYFSEAKVSIKPTGSLQKKPSQLDHSSSERCCSNCMVVSQKIAHSREPHNIYKTLITKKD